MFKSGTSLLRAMLGQHSAIASGLETYWFEWNWTERASGSMDQNFARFATFFDLQPGTVRELAQGAPSPEAFLEALMTQVTKAQGKRRWAEKTPGNVAHLDRIWEAWPDAQVLHIVRDPRDVFASLVEAQKWDNPDAFAARWCATIAQCEALLDRLRPDGDHYKVLRYEDLIFEAAETMRDVLDFLSEPWEDAVGSFEGRQEDYEKVKSATGKASTTLERLRKPLTDARVGIWKSTLSNAQLRSIREAVATRGYGELYDRLTLTKHAV